MCVRACVGGVCVQGGAVYMHVYVKARRCQVRVGVCGSIFISSCQGGDTLMNGAE